MAALKGKAVVKIGMQYRKFITDARVQKPPKRKTSFRTVASVDRGSQYVCIEDWVSEVQCSL